MYRFGRSLALLALLSLPAAGQPDKMAANRMPVPDAAAIEQAEKVVHEVYKADYAKKKTSEQIEFSRRLIKAADDTKDSPAAKFVLYREACDIGARHGDLGAALEAVAGMTQNFQVKPIELQGSVLEVAESARVVPGRAVAEAALEVADDALHADDFDSTFKLLKLANKAATRGGQSHLIAAAASRIREAEGIQQTLKSLEPVRKKLASNANDPGANLIVGRYLCFLRGDWEAGLPHLAKGSDEKLKAAAEQDLTLPLAASDRVDLADRWFNLSADLEGVEQLEARVRAYQWYQQALADVTGLTKTRVEKRIVELEKSPELKSARAMGWRVLFRSSDPSIWNTDTNRGRYQFAQSLVKAPLGLRHLRMAEASKGTFVIIEMVRDKLDANWEHDGYAWAGKNNTDFNGNHLGISDTAWGNVPKGSVAVYNVPFDKALRGWGFGNRSYMDDVQGYSWAGEPILKTIFEIAVKVGPLTAEESRRLLRKKK